MLSLVLYGLLALGLMIGLFLVAARFLPAGEQIAPPLRDEPPWALPAERHLDAGDIEELRLPVALRGYRFAETDLLLDRLVDELRRRDAELERLYGLLIAMPVPDAGAAAEPAQAAPEHTSPEQAAPEQTSPEQAVPEQTVAETATVRPSARSGPPPASPADPE